MSSNVTLDKMKLMSVEQLEKYLKCEFAVMDSILEYAILKIVYDIYSHSLGCQSLV